MKSIVIDGSKTITIGGIEYYYGEITDYGGYYVVVPGYVNCIMANTGGSGWFIVDGRSYKPSDDTVVRLGVVKEYVNPEDKTPFTYSIDYDVTSLVIAQLEDTDAYPITPYSSAKGVILDNGKDIEEQINYMDPAKISIEEIDALAAIGDSTENAINEIISGGSEYRAGIDTLAMHIKELDAKEFPLEISYKITPNFSRYENTIDVTLKEYDTGEPNLNEEYVEKWVNDSYVGKIYDPLEYQSSFSFVSPIQGMKETFKFVAGTVNEKSDEKSAVRYLCFYGANKAASMTSSIALGLTKTLTTGVSFNPTIKTTEGQYIWLIVPRYLSINKVKSAGFDVTLTEEPQYVQIGDFGMYRCYRTLNALADATWKLTIS